jgi:hypothetical protein
VAVVDQEIPVTPAPAETVLAQLAAASVGKGVVFYGIQLITTVLLALAASTAASCSTARSRRALPAW